MPARRRWRRATFDWHYLDAVVLQRLARHAEAAAQLEAGAGDLAGLSAGAREAGRSAARSRRPRREPAAVRGADASRPREPAARVRARPHRRGARAATTRPSRTCSARSRCFRSWAPRTTRSRSRIARSDAATRRSARSSGTRDTARAGRRWRTGARGRHALRDDARANLQRGVKLADAGDLDGRDRGARSGAGARPVDRAGAREPDLALRPRAELGEGRGALPGRRRARRQPGRCALRLRRAARPAGEVGRRRRGLPAGDRRQSAARAARTTTSDRSSSASVRSTRRPTQYRQAVESQPTFRLARFNLGRMLIALGRPDEAIVELEKLTEPRDAEAPRYLFALADRARAGRPPGRRHQVGDRGADSWRSQFGQTRARGGDRARPGDDSDERIDVDAVSRPSPCRSARR